MSKYDIAANNPDNPSTPEPTRREYENWREQSCLQAAVLEAYERWRNPLNGGWEELESAWAELQNFNKEVGG